MTTVTDILSGATTHARTRSRVPGRREIGRIIAIATVARQTQRIADAQRRGRKVTAKMSHAAKDRRVQREARRATAAASRAAQRTQEVGLTRALSDRRVTRDLRRTKRHAARATSLALQRPRWRRVRAAALIVAGTGALAGAAYAGTRKSE
jgi:hypothetical protein